MSIDTLNALFPKYDGEIIDVKIDGNNTGRLNFPVDDVIQQANNVIVQYRLGNTTQFEDY
jgi:hypothetical protein